MHDTLFIMDSAYFDAFDLLQAPDDQSDEILGGWLDSISNNIYALYLCGAHNMLVPYLPDMGSAPFIPPEAKADATEASIGFNYFFLQSIVDFYNGPPFNMNITTVDFFALTTMVLATPEEYGFTNVTDSCVTLGVINGAFCKDRDSYFFWDPLHPSKSAYALMAEFTLPQLPVAE
jgi:phospholipase/lecithinase/hemolysin